MITSKSISVPGIIIFANFWKFFIFNIELDTLVKVNVYFGYCCNIFSCYCYITLVNVYVDLLVFTRIAGTSLTGSSRYWC